MVVVVVAYVYSTATGLAKILPTNSSKSSALIRHTKQFAETRTPNGSPSQCTSIASCVDSLRLDARVVVSEKDTSLRTRLVDHVKNAGRDRILCHCVESVKNYMDCFVYCCDRFFISNYKSYLLHFEFV